MEMVSTDVREAGRVDGTSKLEQEMIKGNWAAKTAFDRRRRCQSEQAHGRTAGVVVERDRAAEGSNPCGWRTPARWSRGQGRGEPNLVPGGNVQEKRTKRRRAQGRTTHRGE